LTFHINNSQLILKNSYNGHNQLHTMDPITIYKNQTLKLLHYNIIVFPPLIPSNYTLFQHNRIVNFHNENIITEILKPRKSKYEISKMFNCLLSTLDFFGIKYNIKLELPTCENKLQYLKIDPIIIKCHMKHSSLWALNESKVIRLPQSFIICRHSKSDSLNMRLIIKRSLDIREYLLHNS